MHLSIENFKLNSLAKFMVFFCQILIHHIRWQQNFEKRIKIYSTHEILLVWKISLAKNPFIGCNEISHTLHNSHQWWSHDCSQLTLCEPNLQKKNPLKLTKKKRSRDLESNWECMMSFACYARDLLRKSATTKKRAWYSLAGSQTELNLRQWEALKAIYNYLCIYVKLLKISIFFSFESESTRKTHSDLISLPAMIQFSSYSYFR